MSYQSLARKYRPKFFSDLVGQEDVASALLNAIRLKRPPSSVIFSGIRGIGKTTVARLYAKALNCVDTATSEPCGTCHSCIAISEGNHEDVLEIDGASHNGVEEVRALKEAVSYIPHRSQYKVFLIDEVHMLSISAFNALLKTLEEPPANVVFIFATTELQKVPATIVGRCQTFYLQKLSVATTIDRLQAILLEENISYDNESLSLVAREGHGSMRDSLMFLDQAIAIGNGVIEKETLENLLSTVSSDILISILSALVERDGSKCIDLIASLDQAGRDFATILVELARLARHGFVLQGLGGKNPDKSFLGLSDSEEQALKTLSESSRSFDLNRLFRLFVKCRQDMDGGNLDRFIFENYCLEWCLDPGFPNVDELLSETIKKKKPLETPQVPQKSRPVKLIDGFKSMVQESAEILDPKKNPHNSDDIKKLGLISASKLQQQTGLEVMPESWEDLVRLWKEKRPLEARKFEEAYLKSYSKELIEISVKPDTLLAKNLFEDPQHQLIKKSLKRLFNFSGDLVISELSIDKDNDKNQVSESILESRVKAKAQQNDEWVSQAKDHELSKTVIENWRPA